MHKFINNHRYIPIAILITKGIKNHLKDLPTPFVYENLTVDSSDCHCLSHFMLLYHQDAHFPLEDSVKIQDKDTRGTY